MYLLAYITRLHFMLKHNHRQPTNTTNCNSEEEHFLSRAECRVLFVSVWRTQQHYRLFGGIDDKVQEIPTICIEN